MTEPAHDRRAGDAKPGWRGLPRRWTGFILSDWRYPAALAGVLLLACVLLALVVTVQGFGDVLDRVDGRGEAAECSDRIEAEFERLLVQLIDAGVLGDSDQAREVRSELLRVTAEETVEACYRIERAAR